MCPQGGCPTGYGRADPPVQANELRVREWAAANGHDVSSRGRISQAVRDAYDAAH
jgi:hypothetical protein